MGRKIGTKRGGKRGEKLRRGKSKFPREKKWKGLNVETGHNLEGSRGSPRETKKGEGEGSERSFATSLT